MDGPEPSVNYGGSLDDVLEHFGVKGMKWGVRRSSSSKASAAPIKKSADAARAEKAKAKIGKKSNTDALSNKELKDLVERMNLEQRYSDLNTKKTERNMSIGQKFAMSLLQDFGKTQGKQAALNFAGGQVKKVLKP